MKEKIASKANNSVEFKMMQWINEICQYRESESRRTAKSNNNNDNNKL